MRLHYKLAGGVALAAAAGTAAAGIGVAIAARQVYRRMRLADLRGDVVLITGGSRGLGLALAEEFARQGCKLVLCARDERELELANERISAFGVDVLTVVCDVAEERQVNDLIGKANERFGRVDVLVNNAGIITVGPIQSQTLEDFERSMNVIFWGTVYPTLAVLPQMSERRSGRIVNITSIGGRISVPHLLPYCCAKFAAIGFSEGLRSELSKEKISVTTVIPGLMRTGSYKNAEIKGRQQAEYGWFALSSSLPLLTVSAPRAARRIVNAVRRGEAEIILTPEAQLASLLHGMAPGVTADVLGLINRALPKSNGSKETAKGAESESPVTHSFLTALGKRARANYQHEGEITPPGVVPGKKRRRSAPPKPAEAIGS